VLLIKNVSMIEFLPIKYGGLLIETNDSGVLQKICWAKRKVWQKPDKPSGVYSQLVEYLLGRRKEFEVTLSEDVGTEFQRRVWNEIGRICYGQTRSYQEVAISLGNKKWTRAVGMACSRNPFLIVVPCHRVVAANGKMGGYIGGGDRVKKWLLNLEGIPKSPE